MSIYIKKGLITSEELDKIEYTIIDIDGTEIKPRPYIHLLGDKEENIYSLDDTIRVYSKLKEDK